MSDLILPNACPHLKLYICHFEGAGDRGGAVGYAVDILGWLLVEGIGALPITIHGPLARRPENHYAILNTEDQSYTEVGGERFASYKDFIGPKFDAYERGLSALAAASALSDGLHREAPAAPQPWKGARGPK